MAYIVYKHTNKTNGKCYIGITGRSDPKRRWGGGSGYVQNKHFYSAIRKYGWDGFKHEIIADVPTLEEAYAMEKELIAKYDSANPERGYNQDLGGNGPGKMSETTIRKHAEIMNRLYRETDLREKISEGGKRRFEKDEEHEKLRKAAILRNQDPEKFNNICEGNRNRWKREGEREKVSEGLKSYYEDNPQRKEEISKERKAFFEAHPEKKSTKKVAQVKNDEIIRIWDSLTEAAEQCKIELKNISAVCRGKRKTAGGYVWRYENEKL